MAALKQAATSGQPVMLDTYCNRLYEEGHRVGMVMALANADHVRRRLQEAAEATDPGQSWTDPGGRGPQESWAGREGWGPQEPWEEPWGADEDEQDEQPGALWGEAAVVVGETEAGMGD